MQALQNVRPVEQHLEVLHLREPVRSAVIGEGALTPGINRSQRRRTWDTWRDSSTAPASHSRPVSIRRSERDIRNVAGRVAKDEHIRIRHQIDIDLNSRLRREILIDQLAQQIGVIASPLYPDRQRVVLFSLLKS